MFNVRSPIVIHRLIAIASFLVLSSVLFFLLYNTYELKNRHYFIQERNVLEEEYGKSVRDDKMFPGGAKLLERYVDPYIYEFERLYYNDRPAFNTLRHKLMDSAFAALKAGNNIDSIINDTKRKHHITRDLDYALIITLIDVNFEKDKAVALFSAHEPHPPIHSVPLRSEGALIGGKLTDLNDQNLITRLMVSASSDYSYRLRYELHIDTPNRKLAILKLMLPNLLLSLFSILAVVIIYYITFRNWQKQKKLSEMKSDFINSITHEFHTPLAAIFVANKSLRNDKITANRDNITPLTDVIQRQAERLQNLIGQVLDITTMSQVPLNKTEHSLHALLEEIMLDYRLKTADTNIHLTFNKGAVRDRVLLDQFWLTTLCLNIMDNGVKYNDKTSREIRVSTSSDKKNIYLEIADNGIGMDVDTRKMVFDKFYRSIKNNNQQIKGLGLGLYYVKQAVDAHHWKINVESVPGEGSIFIITIPFNL